MISYKNLFENFDPGQQLEADFKEFGYENFMILVCAISGFMKVVKTENKSTIEAIRVLREWWSVFGRRRKPGIQIRSKK